MNLQQQFGFQFYFQTNQQVLEHLLQSNDKIQFVFSTAGTGKSYIIKQIADTKQCTILAPTNSAVSNIGKGATTIFKNQGCLINQLQAKTFFDTPYIIIDELFLFNYNDMQIILDCTKPHQKIICFGDQFQILQSFKKIKSKTTQDDTQLIQFHQHKYPYEVFKDYQQIPVLTLPQNFRCQDDKLMLQMITQFTTFPYKVTMLDLIKTYQIPIIDIDECINKVLFHNAMIIVGTHRQQDYYMKKILTIQNKNKLLFHQPDGNSYYMGQQIWLCNQFNSVQKLGTITGLFPKGPDTFIDGVKHKIHFIQGKSQYDFIQAQVNTINILQGQTIKTQIIIDIDDLFSSGSIFTAITRATTLQNISFINMKGLNFNAECQIDLNNFFIKKE